MFVPLPALAPVTPVAAAVQLNDVAPKLLVKLMAAAPPLQIESDGGVAVATGNGFTVTVTVTGDADAQPFALGVTVYTTVPGVVAVAVSTCAMVDPLAADEPVALVSDVVQEKVVPATALVNPMDVAVPEQMVCDGALATASGIGFTLMVTGASTELQPDGVVAVTL